MEQNTGYRYPVCIKKYMRKKHINRADFIKRIGISDNDFSLYLYGIKPIPYEVLDKIQNVTGISRNVLIRDCKEVLLCFEPPKALRAWKTIGITDIPACIKKYSEEHYDKSCASISTRLTGIPDCLTEAFKIKEIQRLKLDLIAANLGLSKVSVETDFINARVSIKEEPKPEPKKAKENNRPKISSKINYELPLFLSEYMLLNHRNIQEASMDLAKNDNSYFSRVLRHKMSLTTYKINSIAEILNIDPEEIERDFAAIGIYPLTKSDTSKKTVKKSDSSVSKKPIEKVKEKSDPLPYCYYDTFWAKKRLEKGYTIEDVCVLLGTGIKPNALNAYFTGQTMPNDKSISMLCEIFDVPFYEGKAEFYRACREYQYKNKPDTLTHGEARNRIAEIPEIPEIPENPDNPGYLAFPAFS